MREPKLEKLIRLHKYCRDLKDTAQSISADININGDRKTRLEASMPNLKKNPDEVDSIRKQILKLDDERTEFQRRHSKISDDLQATIGLINTCEAWLTDRGIPLPADKASLHSHSFYQR